MPSKKTGSLIKIFSYFITYIPVDKFGFNQVLPHPELVFIRLTHHLLPAVWAVTDVGIIAFGVFAIIPIIRCYPLPTVWTLLDVWIEALWVLAIVPIIGLALREGKRINIIGRIVWQTIIAYTPAIEFAITSESTPIMLAPAFESAVMMSVMAFDSTTNLFADASEFATIPSFIFRPY
jgi:hypothetical protein